MEHLIGKETPVSSSSDFLLYSSLKHIRFFVVDRVWDFKCKIASCISLMNQTLFLIIRTKIFAVGIGSQRQVLILFCITTLLGVSRCIIKILGVFKTKQMSWLVFISRFPSYNLFNWTSPNKFWIRLYFYKL